MDISFVSLNLWHGGQLFEEALAFLKEQDADIVVMQEVYQSDDESLAEQYRSVQVLRERLGYPHDDFAADYRDFDRTEGRAYRGNLVLSRFPIKSSNVTFFNEPYSETYRDVPGNFQDCPRNLQHVVLETSVGDVHVFNIQGAWDMDGDSFSPPRQAMSKAIVREVHGLPNVIFAGDTNAKPTNLAMKAVEAELHSVFGESLQSTFNMRRKDNPGYATAAVDMIFVSKNIEVLDSACPDVDVSDHLPVTATLRIPKA